MTVFEDAFDLSTSAASEVRLIYIAGANTSGPEADVFVQIWRLLIVFDILRSNGLVGNVNNLRHFLACNEL